MDVAVLTLMEEKREIILTDELGDLRSGSEACRSQCGKRYGVNIDLLLFMCANLPPDPQCSFTAAWRGLIQLQLGVLSLILNQAQYFQGIAADPPDSG